MAKWFSATVSDSSSGNYYGPFNNRRLLILFGIILIAILLLLLIILLSVLLPMESNSQSKSTSPTISTALPTPTLEPEEKPWMSLRLRDEIRPLHYDMYVRPEMYNANDSYFQGNETIRLEIRKITTRYIVLHKLDIVVQKVLLASNDGSNIKISRYFDYAKYDFLVIEFEEKLRPNTTIDLFLEFTGSLDHNMFGAYKGYFTDKLDNTTKYLASTKFEPTGARMAFPCFDEPKFKAYYTLHMVHRLSHTALFNSKQISSEKLDDNFLLSHFNRTEYTMSTYLVAWVVMPSYSQKNSTDELQRLMRYWAPTFRIDDVDYAKSVGSKLRKYMDSILNYTSPLAKVDQIVIPQFAAGAMENWGLITYRERLLLFTRNYSLETDQYHICRVVAHELAHTWFGNIVSPEWWTELWLNEAFATQFAAIATQNVEKEFHVFEQTILSNRLFVMLTEVEGTARPIVVANVSTFIEMRAMFNSFVYRKGGQLLHWLQSLMTTDKYMVALSEYINRYQFRVARTKDLFYYLDRHYPGAADLMTSWIYQAGYPIISIDFHSTSNSFIAKQQTVLTEQNQKWFIPLQFVTSQNKTIKVLNLLQTTTVINYNISETFSDDSWILFNENNLGYYRIRYDKNLMQRLTNQMKQNFTVFDTLQRSILIDDALFLSDTNITSFDLSLPVIEYIVNDIDYAPWVIVDRYVRKFDRLLSNNTQLRVFIKSATNKMFKVWNIDTGKPPRIMRDEKREDFLFLACYFENTDCLNYTLISFNNWMSDYESIKIIPREVHKWIYYFGLLQNDTETNWNILKTAYQNHEATAVMKSYYLVGMMGTRSSERWTDIFKMMISTPVTEEFRSMMKIVRKLDNVVSSFAWTALRGICQNDQSNCDASIIEIASPIANYFKSESMKLEVEVILKTYAKNATSSINTILNRITSNLEWSQRNSDVIMKQLYIFNTR